MAPIRTFMDAFNRGDAAAAAATHSATADLTIIDEVSPHLWHGPQAFVLKKGPGGWLIHGWTWTGPKPKPVAPAKP